jgi:hypothetical protein
MKSAFARTISRLLVVLLIWSPYHMAQASMIGTDQVVSPASQLERNTVLNFVGRTDVSSQLQALGLDPATAAERIAAMTDEEVRSLAGRINALPAGGDAAGVLLLIVIVAAIWWVWRGGFR